MSREKGKLTTADYLSIKDFDRLVDGLHADELYMWELYCRLSFCTALRASVELFKGFKVRYRLPIKAFSTHTFRKTFGRYVYESNGRSAESLILLNSIFRHSSIDITKVYIGLRQAEIDKVFNSIKF